MKRFYCPKCVRVVRARSLPRDAKRVDEHHVGPTGEPLIRYQGTCHQHPKFDTHKPGWGRRAVDGASRLP